jgi:glucose/arabinose dehydrogenase/mono/diheme cytochrome c family protein
MYNASVQWSMKSLGLLVIMLSPMACALAAPAPPEASSSCAENTGIVLSPGFCATVFADNLGHARHLAIAANGVVYVNTWSGRYYGNDKVPDGGFLIALKDSSHRGHADVIQRFGDGVAEGSAGGTGIRLYNGYLYAEENDRIIRYRLSPVSVAPTGSPEVILSGLPITGDHPMHPFIIDAKGGLFVDLGTATNACEQKNRVPNSPGNKPCTEKETRGGTWRYDANKTGQIFSAAERYAAGIRNGEGMAIDPAGRLLVAQHGRDQLLQDWPALYTADQGPELPAEELMELKQGADYGWPECYYDGLQHKLVLAPEYGGDGGKAVGVCAQRTAPIASFPAHWGPMAVLIVTDHRLPRAYREGAFIAFHGSWNRAPAPQAGYNVIFQPLQGGKASGRFVVFADGFAGAVKEPGESVYRPTGLAVGPDGAIYISEDKRGRIWRVTYHGSLDAAVAAAPAVLTVATNSTTALPPEGMHPDAGQAYQPLQPPPGVSADQVALGDRIFHGRVSGGTCAGCHGSNAKGSPIGSDLTSGQWLWSDGSLPALIATINAGVEAPKAHSGAMPPRGGAPLSDSDVQAVAAYVWAVGHSAARK